MFDSLTAKPSRGRPGKPGCGAKDSETFKEGRSQRIRQAAELRGLSKITALAARLSVSPASVSKWRNGGHLSLENACSIAQALDISLDWLLLERGAPEWHQDRRITRDEVKLLMLLRRRPDRVQNMIQRVVAEIPEEENFPSAKKEAQVQGERNPF